LGGGTEALVESLPIAPLPSSAIWCDINYWMSAPPRLSACAARGLRTSSGLGMLVHQGALSFELFTGYPIAASELRDTLEAKR
jgi:shikimate dehydrogenase